MSIELIDRISPKNNGTFPIAYANEIKGGLHTVETIEDLNLIPAERLEAGMQCYVKNGDVYYKYTGTSWEILTSAASLTIKNSEGNINLNNIKSLVFDENTGLHVTDLGNNEAKVSIGSHFKWITDGTKTITAIGEDTLKILPGEGVNLVYDDVNKSITINSTGAGSGGNLNVYSIRIKNLMSKTKGAELSLSDPDVIKSSNATNWTIFIDSAGAIKFTHNLNKVPCGFFVNDNTGAGGDGSSYPESTLRILKGSELSGNNSVVFSDGWNNKTDITFFVYFMS